MLFNSFPDSPADGFGYLAAARSLIRLNAISPALFPLPHALARAAAGADEDIDLPDDDLGDDNDMEDASGAAPAPQQHEHQRLHLVAGVSHMLLHSASPTSCTRLGSPESLDPSGQQAKPNDI